MPFRLWFYLTKVGTVLFVIIFITLIAPFDFMEWVRYIALCLLVPLCLAGAVLGIQMAQGRLRMRCPFCMKSGRVGGNSRDGLWLGCKTCGFVHGSGPLGLRIVYKEFEKE